MSTHKNLDIWKIAIELVIDVYQFSKNLPSEEKYTLTSQMKRSAISIPSNIAEGAARKGDKEYLKFLNYALGSLVELDTQLIIAHGLYGLDGAQLFSKLEALKRKILKLMRYLESLHPKERK
ncbi:MAG: four helix bundle protein [Flavobacteriales bacterium]|nr:four helix bundle protein [Bacteroidota bacterium]MCB9239833.1 four helix bundle protein [Flavobacteriales bacterium]